MLDFVLSRPSITVTLQNNPKEERGEKQHKRALEECNRHFDKDILR